MRIKLPVCSWRKALGPGPAYGAARYWFCPYMHSARREPLIHRLLQGRTTTAANQGGRRWPHGGQTANPALRGSGDRNNPNSPSLSLSLPGCVCGSAVSLLGALIIEEAGCSFKSKLVCEICGANMVIKVFLATSSGSTAVRSSAPLTFSAWALY